MCLTSQPVHVKQNTYSIPLPRPTGWKKMPRPCDADAVQVPPPLTATHMKDSPTGQLPKHVRRNGNFALVHTRQRDTLQHGQKQLLILSRKTKQTRNPEFLDVNICVDVRLRPGTFGHAGESKPADGPPIIKALNA